MREILFRGKHEDTNEWEYGSLHIQSGEVNENDNQELEYKILGLRGELDYVIPETVGQYTGLTDKNGKKIFEGDIVKFGKYIYQITFECGSFALLDKQGCMIAKIGGINDHCYSLMNLHLECCWEDNWAYDIEIIGNIHDNPELLGGGE